MAPLLSWFLEDITIIRNSPYLENYIKIGGLEKRTANGKTALDSQLIKAHNPVSLLYTLMLPCYILHAIT